MNKNDLIKFNVGGKHEENVLGGIPQGNNNSVEQGETKQNNFIYSDRIILNKDIIGQYGLPKSLTNKTVADATKIIDRKFKDRNDKISTSTRDNMLSKIAEAQEAMKPQEVPQEQMFMGGELDTTEGVLPTEGAEGMNPYVSAGTKMLPSLLSGDKNQMITAGVETGFTAAGTAIGGPVGGQIGSSIGKAVSPMISKMLNKNKEQDLAREKAVISNSAFTNDFAYGGDLEDPYGKKPWKQPSSSLEEDPNYVNPLFKPTNTIPQVGAGKPSNFLGYSINQPRISPKAPTADMNTNIIQNIQSGLNVTADGIWGPKSNQAYFNDRIKRDPEYATLAKKKGLTTANLTNSDFTSNNINEATQKRFGLTSQGYKYLDPETPPNVEMLKSTEQPFVEPTGVQAEMEAYYQKNYPQNDKKYPKANLSKLGDTLGQAARYAPIAMNAYQLSQLEKPAYERLNKLDARFKPEYVDERSLQNIAGNEYDNTVNAITQMGGGEGATRNAILGAGLNKTKALSDAYMNASGQNRQMNMSGQQFNLGVDQANLQQANQELDINDRNQAAYRNAKREYLTGIGEGIGDVGKEEIYKKIAKTTTGYSWLGEFQKMNPNATKEETIIAAKKAGVVIDDDKTAKKQALGGYLIKNKRK